MALYQDWTGLLGSMITCPASSIPPNAAFFARLLPKLIIKESLLFH